MASCSQSSSLANEEIRVEGELRKSAKAGIIDGKAPISSAATFCTIENSELDTCNFLEHRLGVTCLARSLAIALPCHL
jgi:hypothetical protein